MIMKKNILTMLAAILFCGLTVTMLSACSKFSNCNWRLPELGMFYTMIDAAGGYEQLRDGFESVGGENMVRGRYWVTDSFKEGTVVYYKVYDFGKGREGYTHLWTFYERVRACLVYIYLTN